MVRAINDADAYVRYAVWLVCQGRLDEALGWARQGQRLDPLPVSGGSVDRVSGTALWGSYARTAQRTRRGTG